MGTIADKLLYLQDTKSAIKDAIVSKGVTVPTGTSFRDYATKIGYITTGEGGSETADEWVRPTEWLPLPDNIDGVQKVSILNAVFDTDSEFVTIVCNGGNYTIDWGDGTVDNISDNYAGYHKYNYSNVSLNTDTVTKFGYKQCIITITPQSGQNITICQLNYYHTSIGGATYYDLTTGFLDMRINLQYCTNLIIGSTTNSSYVKHTMLQQCIIGELADTTLHNLFYDCYVLQSVSIKDTSNVTTFTNMHYNNYALQKMPTYTFRSAGVDINSMFAGCYSLRETYPIVVTLSNTQALSSAFANCKSLTYIDITIVSNTDYSLASFFQNCSSLEDIKISFTGRGKVADLTATFMYTRIKSSPVIDTSLCALFSSTFQYCDRLTDLYEYDYTSATTLASMLNGCYSLKDAGYFNITSICTSLQTMCVNCYSLEKAPTFSDSRGVTNIASMFSACRSLTTIPNYIFGNIIGTNLNTFTNGCDSLQIMPNITVGTLYTANTSFLNACYSLKRMLMPLRFTFSVVNAKMSANALNEMFSILPTVTNQTVTITGNYGASTCDTSIATAKGWTVLK